MTAAGSVFRLVGHSDGVTGVELDRGGGGADHANAPDLDGPRRALIMVRIVAKTRRGMATSATWNVTYRL